MSDLYRPTKGRRVPLPGSNATWPESGIPIDLSNPYVARLVRDGDLEKVQKKAAAAPAGKPAGEGA